MLLLLCFAQFVAGVQQTTLHQQAVTVFMTNKMVAEVMSKNSPVLLVHCTIVSHNPLKPTSILHKERPTPFRTFAACLDDISAVKVAE